MKKVQIYTDGACSGNPGEGGWGAILIYNGKTKTLFGYENATTNNRMELTAVIEALSALKIKCEVNLYSDSTYVANAINQDWLENWQLNDWKTTSKKPVQNQDLWEKLMKLIQLHNVKFIKVKGHSDNHYNNECDLLAREAISKKCNSKE